MSKQPTVTLWGVRGSLPTPGPETVRYGGHTTCVSVDVPGGPVVIFDAGTGIRPLGKALRGDGRDVLLFVTHVHWDHVIGYPFFEPLYEKGRTIHLFPIVLGDHPRPLDDLFEPRHFPVTRDRLSSPCDYVTEGASDVLAGYGLSVSAVCVAHPGLTAGYRLEVGGRSVVFIPDNELGADPAMREAVAAFASGADVLIHDAQYLDDEIEARRGWGHSSVGEACSLAAEAAVGELVLFHHDPDRTDDTLDAVGAEAAAWMQAHAPNVQVTVAREGRTIPL
ncbi:MAG: MBL fold metallo-hydrolase [Sandaracinaceae bacterium]